jgi:hypothetical protein
MSAAAVSLMPIGPDDVWRVTGLQLAPDQRQFAGDLADAIAAAEPGVDFHMIVQGADVVGFFKIDRD